MSDAGIGNDKFFTNSNRARMIVEPDDYQMRAAGRCSGIAVLTTARRVGLRFIEGIGAAKVH